ncbi:MAG: branched-chain amino acid transport system permease protein [Micromonosporaceae bacterium]
MTDVLQALVNGLLIGSVFALVAVGLTLIYGVMDIVNFAHGEMVMAGMYASFFAWSVVGLDPLVSLPIAGVSVGVVGGLMYLGVIGPVLGKSPLAQVIATFGVQVFLRGLAQFLWTPDTRTVRHVWADGIRLHIGGVLLGGPQLVMAGGALLCTLAVAALMNRTRLGGAIRAAGEDQAAAALMGINPRRMYALAWVIAGTATGVAGGLVMNAYSASPTAGVTFVLMAFVVVALGGFGSIGGAAVAGLLIGAVQGVVGRYASSYTLVAALGIYLLVVLVRPRGLMGTR